MKYFTTGLAMIIALVGLAGCSPICMSGCTADTSTLKTRAAFDMACPQESLELTKLNDPLTANGTMYGVTGCGKRSTYISKGTDTWVLNSAQNEAEPAQP